MSRKSKHRATEVTQRRLTDDPGRWPLSIGCHSCLHLKECGGLSLEAGIFDCLDFCCNKPTDCQEVCRRNVNHISQFREIEGYGFATVPRTERLGMSAPDDVVPMIYHGATRARRFSSPTVALRLADLVDFRNRRLRFSGREELAAAYGIRRDAQLIVSGVDHDRRVEPWWSLAADRSSIIDALRTLRIDIVTVPNFSVTLASPRTDDLHAMKRILICFAELQSKGVGAALHPNGRTQHDFDRWGEAIAARPEIEVLSYEFITGPGRSARRQFHLDQLAGLAVRAGRSLDIIVRGDPNVVPVLRESFRSVTYIETTAFLKTANRHRATRAGNRDLAWRPDPHLHGQPIDDLLEHNCHEQRMRLRSRFYSGRNAPLEAA